MEAAVSTPGEQPLVTPPAVVADAGRESPLVVIQDTSLLSWVVVEPPGERDSARELWRLAGNKGEERSIAERSSAPQVELAGLHATTYGPTVGELFGEGSRSLIIAGASLHGAARLVAVDIASGSLLWSRDFERFSAGNHPWNFGGALITQTGKFTRPHSDDVLVTFQRSRMHSEETYVLDGRNGEVIWHRDRQIADRSFGGEPFALADFDNDGLGDLASFYTHIRYIVDGASGKDLLAMENEWPEIPLKQVYWGQPIAGRFDPVSLAPSLLFTTTGKQMIGRVEGDGSLVWSDAYDRAANGFPAVGDFDGDGQMEAIFFGFADGTRCYDAKTGRIEWTLDLAANQNVPSAVSGDIDGDDRDEAIFVLDNTLYCVGSTEQGRSGTVEWNLELPTAASAPILADVWQSGERLSVLVTGQDGFVYCIDSAEPH
jgi:outer membrane protein assembly factor BamB